MTTEMLKERLVGMEGRFLLINNKIRHRKITDAVGRPACPLIVALNEYRNADTNHDAVRLAIANGISRKNANIFYETSDFSLEEAKTFDDFGDYDPELRRWMEAVLLRETPNVT